MNRRDLLRSTAAAAAITLASPLPLASAPADFPYDMKTKSILGNKMAYVDTGSGRPVVFLHGNPTSSYLWRNILLHVADTHRVIAPDLIGMGQSSKPDIDYKYADHAAHLHGLLDALDLQDAVLVIHDWGSALGLDWASKNPDRVSAVAFMEAVLPPVMPAPSYEAFGEFGDLFKAWQTPGVGEKMILEDDMFLQVILRQVGVKTPLSDEVMAHYTAPYPTAESRAPLLAWPREVPFGDQPANVIKVIDDYSEWFLASDMPKLMFHVTPGALIPPQAADWLKANLRNLQSVHLGEGTHYIQEDYPTEIGTALATWLKSI